MNKIELSNLETFGQIVRGKDKDGWRIYQIDNKPYVSVTEVLSYFVPQKLKNWFIKTSAGQIEKRRSETAKQGSDIHKQAEEGTEARLNALMSDLGMETIKNEFIVHSKHGWAGTVDKLVRWKGKNWLIDEKSGSFGHAALQIGGYSLAANEMGMNVEGIGVISLPRDLTQPAKYFDYTDYEGAPDMEENQYAWCTAFDTWKREYYKKLQSYEWYATKTVFQYNWSWNYPK